MQPLTVTVDRAAELTGLSAPTIWRMIRREQIASTKCHGRRLINLRSLQAAVGAA